MTQGIGVGLGDLARRNTRDLRDNILDMLDADDLRAFLLGEESRARTCLVNDIDCLVRQVPFVDVLLGEFSCSTQCIETVLDLVMLLESALEPLENVDRLLDRRLVDVDLLEAARQGAVLLEDVAKLRIGCRTDTAQLPRGKRRLQQVGGIHGATRGRARPDDGMDLVDKENDVLLLLQLGEHRFQSLLEIPAILGPRDKRSEVKCIDQGIGKHLGYITIDNLLGHALRDCGFADTGFTDEQRIVLAPAAKNLDGTLHLEVPPDERVDAPLSGLLVEIHGKLFERGFLSAALFLFLLEQQRIALIALVVEDLGYAVRNVIDYIEPGHILQTEKVNGMRLLLAEECNQHIDTGNLAFSG